MVGVVLRPHCLPHPTLSSHSFPHLTPSCLQIFLLTCPVFVTDLRPPSPTHFLIGRSFRSTKPILPSHRTLPLTVSPQPAQHSLLLDLTHIPSALSHFHQLDPCHPPFSLCSFSCPSRTPIISLPSSPLPPSSFSAPSSLPAHPRAPC